MPSEMAISGGQVVLLPVRRKRARPENFIFVSDIEERRLESIDEALIGQKLPSS
jgi:hypothetical protein